MNLDVAVKLSLSSDGQIPFVLSSSIQVDDGEIVGLLGPSGSGKSMTLKCIAGIVKPDAGHVTIGHKVLFDSKKEINLPCRDRRVGYLFQSYALFPHMTVMGNLMCSIARDKGESSKQWKLRATETAEHYLELLHIDQLKKRYPRQLSGGQQQRVALARLFASSPEVILLDEPFSALDTELKDAIADELKETLLAAACPVIFVSHNDAEVKLFCSRTIRISDGKTSLGYSLKSMPSTDA
ncbi:MAG: ATP-binding cassette domain-containing protein [Spirochaetia bacterium]|jgi:ABC-type sulfate/molybdate transport systems ATPase subunit|nr:ATP-binding cassette domain-containing protein [Spirochaetia bacterium]